ncbi:UV radiation resistance protein and autophagy-related subunit 14-domain-containing protein [Stachybotrys elegans]|uniref:UV radiation resistance protein and autophagy-related subunit 14-domain-containing protein n=1 Tax=Stachybotrys elegans TaxID=80388 RepID=A0A8K0WQC2_9HYPO|nr:UV radiation resistance protein and autophagy-related subunit 14-domain-containing protein [Stachybotrys elegans]
MSSMSEPRRPRLLPQNRKLRHLKGLSLRNLSFDPPTHLRTSDDTSLLNKSPGKLRVLQESSHLHASRSSESLRKDSLRPDTLKKQRSRRTSLNFAHANPTQRQKKIEDLVDAVVGDVFFTLHVSGEDEPVYISEVREKSTNFNFQFFELGDQAAAISRACLVTIRIWARRPKSSSWIHLAEELIDLRQLNFIGTLQDRKFPPNALIFHLQDGIYSLDFPSRTSEPKQATPVSTSSYNALMKLANLESSIDDAIQTQQHIMSQINRILEETPVDASDVAGEEARLAEKYVASQTRLNRAAERRRDELRESLKSRRAAMEQGRRQQAAEEENIEDNMDKLTKSKLLIEQTERQIRGQRRRICCELSEIFPITPIPHAPPLSFQICNIPLPNSVYDSATAKNMSEDVLSAALGITALLTRHLAFYLSYPLPYAVYPVGSRSYARDDISQLSDKNTTRKEFPLYLPRGGSTSGQWRFEYGWFLLNKDIEALCASQGLKVVDIRHSLPNLKYLLYVCSAGSDEVPERKKGGVRGLWAGRMHSRMSSLQSTPLGSDQGSLSGSRRGSIDSDVAHNHSDALRTAALGDSGVAGLAEPTFVLPFGDAESKLTLRTKGMREHVGR